MEVLPFQLLLSVLNRYVLTIRHSCLGVLGIFVKIHTFCLLLGWARLLPHPVFFFSLAIVHLFEPDVKRKIALSCIEC